LLNGVRFFARSARNRTQKLFVDVRFCCAKRGKTFFLYLGDVLLPLQRQIGILKAIPDAAHGVNQHWVGRVVL
jgi:hypothetical protein